MRILVADDDRASRHVICAYLCKWGHEVVPAMDGIEALKILRTDTAISIALVDWMMPGLDGLEVCRQLRALPSRTYTYMISVTARTSKQDLVCALEAGFDDFLTKPVEPEELNARLLVGSRIVDLQKKLIQTCERSQFEATHDSLTGLWNRAAILEFLRAELAVSVRKSNNLGVMLLDIDHFKRINDCYGHAVGDSVLIHIAELMHSNLRVSDWVGRYGGEEFLVIASESTAENMIRVAERLRLAIANNPFRAGAQTISATISIGIANTRAIESPTPKMLIEVADSALYRAKKNGRNRIEVNPEILSVSLYPENQKTADTDSVEIESARYRL